MVDVKLRHLFSWQSVPEEVQSLDWNEQMMSTWNSSVPSWTPVGTWIRSLIPLDLLPGVKYIAVLGWRLWSITFDTFGQVSPLIYTAKWHRQLLNLLPLRRDGFSFSRILHKWKLNGNNTMHFQGELPSFTEHNYFEILLCLCILIVHFFSSLSLK